MDVFTWSLPFVCEKSLQCFELVIEFPAVTEILASVLSVCSEKELDCVSPVETSPTHSPSRTTGTMPSSSNGAPATVLDEAEKRRQVIRNKIKAVGKMTRFFSVLREECESITELKNLMGTTILPQGSLALGAEGIKKGAWIEVWGADSL